MKLLLVEDDEMLGRATMNALQRESLRVDWVRNGMDAKIAARSHEYDAILLDLGLPDMAGEQFLQQLRGLKNNTPVIVLTARDQMRDRVNALDLGADDYLVKAGRPGRTRRPAARGAAPHRPPTTPPTCGCTARSSSSRARACALVQPEVAHGQRVRRAGALLRRPRVVSQPAARGRALRLGRRIESNAIEVYVHFLRRKFTPGLIADGTRQGPPDGQRDVLNAEVARKARQAS